MASNPFPELRPYDIAEPARGPETPEQFLERTMREERDQSIRDTIITAPPPAQVAKESKAARRANVVPAIVSGRADEAEKAFRADDLVKVGNKYPSIGTWAARNPRDAVVASEDTENLGLLGSIWDTVKKVPAELNTALLYTSGLASDMFASISEATDTALYPIDYVIGAYGDASGLYHYDPDRAWQKRRQYERGQRERIFEQAEKARPKYTGPIQEGLLRGLDTSILTAVALATRNPQAASTVIGSVVGTNAYQEARIAGKNVPDAVRYAIEQGSIETLTELAPSNALISEIVAKSPFGKTLLHYLAAEIPGEMAATFGQSYSDWLNLHPDQPVEEWLATLPEEELQTVLGVVGGSAFHVATLKTVEHFAGLADRTVARRQDAQRAQAEQRFIERLGEAALESKLRGADPEAYEGLIRELSDGSVADRVYVPGEAVTAYMQSDQYDANTDPLGAYEAEAFDAAGSGGDLSLPSSFVFGKLPGTPAWEALKPDMRLSPGGMTGREVEVTETMAADELAQMSERLLAEEQETARTRSAIQKLTETAQQRLQDAGFTPSTARTNAALIAQRYATRKVRLGEDLTGDEFDTAVRQVLPEGIATAKQADQLDIVINAMRRASEERKKGRSLLEWISDQGGIEDRGGDVAALGGNLWHMREPFRKKLIRPREQGGLFGEGSTRNTLDLLLQDAITAGYFPDLMAQVEQLGPDFKPDRMVLLEAIRKELAGEQIYSIDDAQQALDEQIREAADDLKQMLVEMGIQPETASDEEIRAAVEEMAAQVEGGLTYEQAFEDGPRGRIVFPATGYGTGETIIELFKGRNNSTFIHETGHLWLEELRADASRPDAPEQLREDWQQVQDWFAKKGYSVTDTIPVEAHEMWARGVERYLMEGKAPSTGLARIFAEFKSWLINIYKTVSALNSPISDEIRGVMDRLIATDEEIAAVREEQNLSSMFDELASFGATEEEVAQYREMIEGSRDEAHDALLAKTLRSVRARVTKEYRNIAKGLRPEVEKDINARREFRAMRMLKWSPMDREAVAGIIGEDALSLLPRQVPPIYREGGEHPDTVAEMTGFSSGREMLETLMGLKQRKDELKARNDNRSVRMALIDQEVEWLMNERYGDPFTDGSIEEEARALVHNEKQGEAIAYELKILSRTTGRKPTAYQTARRWAEQRIRSGLVKDEASPAAIQRYERAARKAGREAMQAALARDNDAVFLAKQRQMLNNALVSAAKNANEEIQTAVKRLERIAKKKTIKSVDQDYLDQAHALLENVDLKRRSQVSIDRQGNFEAWAAAREAEGYDIAVPASFEATLGQRNWSRLSVEELLGLDAAVKQVIHLGRTKQTMLDNKDRREFEEIVGEAVEGAGRAGNKPPKGSFADPSWWDSIKSGVASLDAGLLKMEQVFRWLDNGKMGAFTRHAFKPIADAQARENDMLADYYGRVKKAMGAIPAKTLKRWGDKITLGFIDPETGLPAVLSRQRLIAMALNTGNEGNLQRLSDGYGRNIGAIQEALNVNLTQEEWQFIQNVWDIFETLWPEIETMEHRVNGVVPERVEAQKVETPFGTLRGGYYPAVYDSSLSYTAEQRADAKENELFSPAAVRATTRASATKERTGKNPDDKILLDIGVINRHLGELIHDITHREAVVQAWRFLSDKRIMDAVDRSLGSEIRKQFRPWVRFVANSWAHERAGNEGAGKYLSKLRSNVTVVGMGFRASTIMTQFAGYSNSFEYVGEKWVTQAIAQSSAHWLRTYRFVMGKSGEMRHRMDTLDRDIRLTVKQMAGKGQPLSAAKRFAFHGIGYADMAVSVPTWLAGYNKALASGATEEDAIFEGDAAVRLSQGAGSPKDLAAVARGTGRYGELLKILTMFYSYMSAFYQRQRTLGRDIARGKAQDLPRLLARAWWLIIVPPVLAELLAGRGPDDDEDEGLWAFKKMMAQSLGAVPIARDLFEPSWDKVWGNRSYGYKLSPLQNAGESVERVAGDIGNIVEGEETTRATRNAMESVGYFTGMVPGQLAASTQFLVDVGEGDADPKTIGDWYEGLATGRIRE